MKTTQISNRKLTVISMMNNTLKQNSFKNKKFSIDQYWKIYFTQCDHFSWEKEYITIVKARSFDYAISILKKKLSKDKVNTSFKNFKGHMFHKNYQFVKKGGTTKSKLITIKDWEDIRNCAFPNENNFLFKYLISEKIKEEV